MFMPALTTLFHCFGELRRFNDFDRFVRMVNSVSTCVVQVIFFKCPSDNLPIFLNEPKMYLRKEFSESLPKHLDSDGMAANLNALDFNLQKQ